MRMNQEWWKETMLHVEQAWEAMEDETRPIIEEHLIWALKALTDLNEEDPA